MMSPFRSYMSSSKRRSSDHAVDYRNRVEGFRLIEIPFSPLRACNEQDLIWDIHENPAATEYQQQQDFEFCTIAPRDYESRQEYLRSYTFSKERKLAPEKIKKSLLRLKAAAWAVVACNYRLPLRARMLKETIAIRTSQYLRSGVHFLRPSCMEMPKCSSLIATSAC
jgi:hypothetical protein